MISSTVRCSGGTVQRRYEVQLVTIASDRGCRLCATRVRVKGGPTLVTSGAAGAGAVLQAGAAGQGAEADAAVCIVSIHVAIIAHAQLCMLQHWVQLIQLLELLSAQAFHLHKQAILCPTTTWVELSPSTVPRVFSCFGGCRQQIIMVGAQHAYASVVFLA